MIPDFASVTPLVCIGGGNMASALIGGLLRQGLPADHLHIVEPFAMTAFVPRPTFVPVVTTKAPLAVSKL